MENERYNLFVQLVEEFDRGCDLAEEYDALLHNYNGTILFQAESQMIKMIGDNPGITASEISKRFGKTGSASSQLIRKMKEKGWVRQERNPDNNRLYNLFLTEEGETIYQNHKQFEERCYQRTFHSLDEFTEEELRVYIAIQRCMNATFHLDGVKRDPAGSLFAFFFHSNGRDREKMLKTQRFRRKENWNISTKKFRQ